MKDEGTSKEPDVFTEIFDRFRMQDIHIKEEIHNLKNEFSSLGNTT